jgi:hypothetical protein
MARLLAVQAAFHQPTLRTAMAINGAIMPPAQKGRNNWDSVVKKEDEDDQQGGGRGTMKGNRGKYAEQAKAAMRRLSRK